MPSAVLLLVGTQKGLFLFESDEERKSWRETGPLLASWEINGLLADYGRSGRLLAGTGHRAYGPTVRISEDRGASWSQQVASPRFNDGVRTVRRIWQLAIDPHAPDLFYAGVDDAALFVSRDAGATWRLRDTLAEDATRSYWSRTAAGNPLHSIVFHPEKRDELWALIGGAGVAHSTDGGEHWSFRNAGLPPAEDARLSDGVHRLVLDPQSPDTLVLQHREGAFITHDGGSSWRDYSAGLPTRFGFALEIAEDGTRYALPVDPATRCFPEGKVQLYHRARGDERWRPAGAPCSDEPFFVGALRDALAVDRFSPRGIYFGTTQGDVFVSADGGESWQRLPGNYSRVNTVSIAYT